MNSKHRGSEEGQGFGINPNVGEEGEGQVVREATYMWVIPGVLGALSPGDAMPSDQS